MALPQLVGEAARMIGVAKLVDGPAVISGIGTASVVDRGQVCSDVSLGDGAVAMAHCT